MQKSLHHKSWGADRKTLQMLRNMLILAKLVYGATVYGSVASTTPQTWHSAKSSYSYHPRCTQFQYNPKTPIRANTPPLSHRRSLQFFKPQNLRSTSIPKSPAYSRKDISSTIQFLARETNATQYLLLPRRPLH